jgi:hypothetical protein
MHNGMGAQLTCDRGLVHSADADEIDHLEAYLNQQIPALGDAKSDTSL